MSEYLGTQGVKYIVGRPFTSEEGEHTTGEEIPARLAESWRYLEAFVDTGLLYKVYGEGYDRLPPHVFTAVRTKEEALAAIEGDQSFVSAQNEWEKTPQMEQAEKEAEVQEQLHQLVLDHAAQAHDQAGHSDAEKLLATEQEQLTTDSGSKVKVKHDDAPEPKPAKKTAAKKA